MYSGNFSKKKVFALITMIFTLIVLLFIVGRANPPVTFKDKGLEEAIRIKLDRSKGPIYQTDLAIMTELDASNKNIHSLDGIEKLTKLVDLNLQDNKVKDVSPLASVKTLKNLNLRNNEITDLEDINFGSITSLSLRRLSLRHNVKKSDGEESVRLSNIELLRNFKELERLELRDNHISDLSPIEGLTRLRHLDIRENKFEEIEALSNLKELEKLNLRENEIDSIDVLSDLTNLKYLNIHSDTSIKSLGPIKNLVNLETLIMRNVPIGNELDIFENLTKLQRLNAIDTGIEKVDLQTFSKLRSLGALSVEVRPSIVIETIDPPRFSHTSGFYDKGFKLKMDSEVEDEKIYYTLDGSDPTIDSDVYEDDSVIPIDLSDEDKATVVRAKIIRDDSNISKTITNTYFVDKNIKDRYKIPVVAISTDDANLFDKKTGIYNENNAKKRGSEWERPIHIEYFESDGKLGFKQNAGARIHGGVSREFKQKTFRLYASLEYDKKDEFDYEIFEDTKRLDTDKRVTKFKRLLLRNSGSDWTSTMFRDAMMQSLVEPLGTMDTQSYQPSAVYLNGKYWGIYNIRERYDEYYLQDTYGVDKDKVSMLEKNADISFGDSKGEKHYNDMLNYIRENGVSEEEHYDYIKTKMDVENFRDYLIVETYFANQDWPHNNIRFWRLMTDTYVEDAPYGHDGRWRWMLYDTDHGFAKSVQPVNSKNEPRDFRHNTVGWMLGEFGGWELDLEWPNFLIREMFKNEGFKTDFLKRYADLLNSYFLPKTVIEKIDKLEAGIEPEMPNHIERWGKMESMDMWHKYVNVMRPFANKRPLHIRRHLMSEFNIEDILNIAIQNDFVMGNVKINSILIDKDLPGVDESRTWKGVYFKDIPISIEALPKEGYKFSHWEGLDSNDTDRSITITPKKDKNIRAVFQRK